MLPLFVFRPRSLFQFKPYCEQEPLSLSTSEAAAVVEAVCGSVGGTESVVLKLDDAKIWEANTGGLWGATAGASTGEVSLTCACGSAGAFVAACLAVGIVHDRSHTMHFRCLRQSWSSS